MLHVKEIKTRTLVEILWLIFLPNTIYLLSDLIHLPGDLAQVSGFSSLVIIFMYIVLVLLGFVTFYLALRPIDSLLSRNKRIKGGILLLIINLLVGVGLVMGRILRLNSWDLLTNPGLVIHSIFYILQNGSLLILSLVLGFMSILIYLGMRGVSKFL